METPPEALCVKHHLSLVEPGIDGDTNHLLPLQVARQLLQEGIIGALPAEHYSFMGYIPHPHSPCSNEPRLRSHCACVRRGWTQ